MTSTETTDCSPRHKEAHWGGVWAMTLCVFALIASEFMPVSLLSPLSQDLAVSEGLVGQGIAISGALAVITSLSITRIAGNLDRKILLLALTLVMALSGLMVAMAPNYLTYMTGRALIGVVIGGFWSMSAAVAIRLVPPGRCRARWPFSTAAMRWRRLSLHRWAAISVLSLAGAGLFQPGAGSLDRPDLAGVHAAIDAGQLGPAAQRKNSAAAAFAAGYGGYDRLRPALYGPVHPVYLSPSVSGNRDAG